MSRLAKALDRGAVKALFGGQGWAPVNAFAPGMSSAWGASSTGEREQIGNSFEEYVRHAYKSNGIVFACVAARAMPFSEARFQFQRLENGRPTDLYGSPVLSILEQPWPNGTTGELLWRMEQDASLAGNCYLTRSGGRIKRLRPDWLTIVSGVVGDPEASAWELQSELLGYIYEPIGVGQRIEPVFLSPEAVVHYSPIPDPLAQWRGMSWLTPVLREIQSDTAATKHKQSFFENGATLGLAIRYDASKTPEQIARYKEIFDQGHKGAGKAYTTLHLGGGADTSVITADMKQLDFKATQGAGETRIAAAAGVGAIMARFSEGLAGSSLNQGNYQAAIRQFTDMTLRPLWRSASTALSKFSPPPLGSRLWYDVRDVALLAESAGDEADIVTKDAAAIRQLIDAGFEPDAVIRAVDAKDLSLLSGSHSGLYSVQLQRPGAASTPGAA